ncbi:putative protein TPRXL, partial [Bradysia coprophila]|uniref:putative protein TPRXL n=1 Tax=Bradysia coprophila TaxID=38358 RepID=UPI00187DBDA0
SAEPDTTVTNVESTTSPATTSSSTAPDTTVTDVESTTSPATTTTELSSSTEPDTTPEASSTGTTNESEPSETTTDFATTPNSDFTCTKAGRFPNLNDASCGSYILCAVYNGAFISQIQSCSNSNFDPDLGRCSLDYVCPGEVTSTPLPGTTLETDLPTTQSSTTTDEGASTTSTEESSTVTEPPNFECTRNGRYPNTAEPGCKSYLACKGSGPFTVEIIWCNGTEIYSPNHGRCVRPDEYVCPDATTTPTTETSTEFHSSESGEITNTDGSSTTSDLSSTTLIDVSTYPPECMAEPLNQFRCPESGRYKDVNSTDCKTYILCLRTVIGQLVYAYLNCEDGTIFSDEARMCVPSHTYMCGQ